MQYRREIDGLRAVAVLPVILFHAGFPSFSGGYVGVDVFFVISGYLITSILINEIRQDKFSLKNFYERRARRILPALFFVAFSCLPFAYLWMPPEQIQEFSESIVAAILSVSNIYFLSQVEYFAPSAETQPLLHTWSLAIEEQYYLLFPLLLLSLRRLRFYTNVVVITLLVLLSFAFSEWAWRENAERSFFFTLSRFWEIGIGSLCAFASNSVRQVSSNSLSSLGVGLILFGVFSYNESTPFPSAYTLAPVTGAAFVILFGWKDTWVARLLSMKAFVGLGLISYSAYLWHQPLFAFARLRSLAEPSHILMMFCTALSLILAAATWYYVERPFRRRTDPLLARQRDVFIVSGAVGVALTCVGIFGALGDGLEWRFDRQALRFIDAQKKVESDACFFDTTRAASVHPQSQCLSSGIGKVDALLIGDSHMWALSEELRNALDQRGISYYSVSHSSCLPLLGFKLFEGSNVHDCQEFLRGAFDWAKVNDVKTVVLAARFPIYIYGTRFNNGEGGVEAGDDGWVDLLEAKTSAIDDQMRFARVLAGFETAIRDLSKDFNVVLVYPFPEAGWDVPSYGFKNALFNGSDTALTTSYEAYRTRSQEVNSLFDRLSLQLSTVYPARVYEVLCSEDTGRCINADSSGIYYFDDDHLSNAGARLVAPMITESVESSLLPGEIKVRD